VLRKIEFHRMNVLDREQVLSIRHWTPRLFSFTTTRNSALRFSSGQFTMIGLQIGDGVLLRAYSMASAHYEDTLQFLSINVPGGPLTSRLQHIAPGDLVFVSRRTSGTLLKANLLPGEVLYLIATGSGLAPFASIIKDPDIYDSFEQVVLFHGCRCREDLEYGRESIAELKDNELVGDSAPRKLLYLPSVTREAYQNSGRITDLINSGKLFDLLGLPGFRREHDRIMLCGNPNMIESMRLILSARGLIEGHPAEPGHFVVERAFVER
jgi:ferredoxin--NADP+ reductase